MVGRGAKGGEGMGLAAAADVLGGWGGMVPASPDHAPAARGPLRPLTHQHEQEMCCCCFAHAVTTFARCFAVIFAKRSCSVGCQHEHYAFLLPRPPQRPPTLSRPLPRSSELHLSAIRGVGQTLCACTRPQPVRTQKHTWVGAGKEGGERGTAESATEARERPNFEM